MLYRVINCDYSKYGEVGVDTGERMCDRIILQFKDGTMRAYSTMALTDDLRAGLEINTVVSILVNNIDGGEPERTIGRISAIDAVNGHYLVYMGNATFYGWVTPDNIDLVDPQDAAHVVCVEKSYAAGTWGVTLAESAEPEPDGIYITCVCPREDEYLGPLTPTPEYKIKLSHRTKRDIQAEVDSILENIACKYKLPAPPMDLVVVAVNGMIILDSIYVEDYAEMAAMIQEFGYVAADAYLEWGDIEKIGIAFAESRYKGAYDDLAAVEKATGIELYRTTDLRSPLHALNRYRLGLGGYEIIDAMHTRSYEDRKCGFHLFKLPK